MASRLELFTNLQIKKMNILEEAQRVLIEESEALVNLSKTLDDSFVEACENIKSAKKVILSGVGKSGIIAKKIAATFSSVGIPALFLHPVEALHGDIGIVENDDITILISKSGSTDELVLLFPYLKKRTKVISITSRKNSFLSEKSDVHIYVPVEKEACPIEIAPTTSTTATMALGDALAACVMRINNFNEIDFAQNHPLGQLGRNLSTSVKDVMHTGESLPFVSKDDNFKNALLVMTNKPLGCVCVVENDKLVGIITDGDCRRALNNNDVISEIELTQVMTSNPITIREDILVGRALSIMENRKSQISVLPVVDENNLLVGLVRIHDLIKSSR